MTRFSLPERRGRTAPSNRAGTPKLSSEPGTEWVELPSKLCLKQKGVMSNITDNILMDGSKKAMITGVVYIRQG